MAGLGARVGDAYASDTEPAVGGAAGVGFESGGGAAGAGFEPGGGAVGVEVARNEREFHHSMKRRCFAHDYRARSIYMVTLEVKGRRPHLGRICPEKLKSLDCGRLSEEEVIELNQGLFAPSEIGRLVAEEFMKIGEHVPGVKPLLAQAMPDHFHGIVFVTREINRSLGSIMAGFKGKCSSLATALRRGHRTGAGQGEAVESLWEPGYHDRILTSEGQLDRLFIYVRDNPRRKAIRLKYPDLFTTVRCVAGRGHTFQAFGNAFLFQRETIAQVQCSRSFFGFKRVAKTDGSGLKIARNGAGDALAAFETPEFAAKRAELFAAAKKGAVLCSPCISNGEKAIAYAAVDAGHSLIVLRNEPFPPMFKSSGRFFDACAEGRLLLLFCDGLGRDGLTPCAPNRKGITRAECLALNALVAEICGGMGGDICYHGMTGLRETGS